MTGFQIQPLVEKNKDEWRALFEGYAEFYKVPMDDTIADTVWGWLLDSDHVLEGYLARDAGGKAIGIVHIRACPDPLGGCEIGFLDDMYVVPEYRGSGVADDLFETLRKHAAVRGWPEIHWITQHFNKRARAFYDRYTSGPSEFILYSWEQDASY
ncbi:MAG: GNAT family N-acetyltransferase [Gammaproteobacteria bacterium]|jgi:GNAT superfamily N-acetyltransferase